MVRRNYLLLLASGGWLLSACPGQDQALDPTGVTPSTRGNLRFKGPERLNTDIASALELPPAAVCTELGLYPCTSVVHNVALGGVDPYGTGLYESSGVTSLTTPLVVERVAWSACSTRVDADLAKPAAAVVFRGIPLNADKLATPDGEEVKQAIAQLTQRALQRDPYPSEVTRYVQLAKDIEALGQPAPARAWMLAVCFAVLSSSESVFY